MVSKITSDVLIDSPSRFRSSRLERMLADNTWLRKKLNRKRRIKEHVAYIDQYAPELWSMSLGLVIDFGCSDGVFLEIARSIGHAILGIEAPCGENAMGKDYWLAAKITAQTRAIPVDYCGVLDWLTAPTAAPESVHFINCRGAIEQIFHELMEGESSHLNPHWEARRWKDGDALQICLDTFLLQCRSVMHTGGVLLISANGAANGERLEQACAETVRRFNGMLRYENQAERVHKWTKVEL